MRRHHERRHPGERRERGERPGRGEEMRVDDVRLESPGHADGLCAQADVLRPRTAAVVDHGALELVALRDQLALELGDEDAEIRVRGARVHLRDEQDAHLLDCRLAGGGGAGSGGGPSGWAAPRSAVPPAREVLGERLSL